MKQVMFPLAHQTNTKLIKYPDSINLFANVEVKATTVYANYSGNLPLTASDKIISVLPLTNIAITNAVLHGSIYWITENTAMVITGNVALPDGDYMLMAERVVDASQVVDDARFVATVVSGVMTLNVTFKTTGNYKFSANRLNRGLDRIGAGVHLAFDDIEFDVYV